MYLKLFKITSDASDPYSQLMRLLCTYQAKNQKYRT